ncbi:MAG: HD domain-containing protein [Desulfurococcales archaeon]|nr:HD domain-containing protein [Desulfurococcales archaeon]
MNSKGECQVLCRNIGLINSIGRILLGGDPAHGWPHVERVRRLAWEIVSLEGLEDKIDQCILEVSIALHDVGRSSSSNTHHAVESARIAVKLLEALGAPSSCVKAVEHAILAHSYSLGVKAETLEARVLSDADKLDALGAIGIARVFHTGCRLGRGFGDSVKHFHDKILRLPGTMYLDASRKIAAERLRIIEDFLREWSRELDSGP